MKKLIALSSADLKNIIRDSTLVLILFGTAAIFVVLRFAVPLANNLLLDKYSFDLTEYYPLIVIYMSMLPSLLFGMLTGFIILDERDEEIISFIAVTPLGKKGYFAYKILSSVVMSFVFFFINIYASGLVNIPLVYSIGLALLTALEAPIGAIFLAAFASNKVEGMALSKVLGMIYIAPFIAYFVKSDLQYFAGVLPTFWVTKAFFSVYYETGGYWLFVLAGLLIHLLFIFLLGKKFYNSGR